MNKLLVTSALALTLVASQAQATQQWPYWYVGLTGGVAFLDDTDISGTSTGNLEYGNGEYVSLSLGYTPPALGGLRFEGEFGYRFNSLDTLTVSGVSTSAPGHVQALTYMANAYYDFRNTSQWTPYVGGGVGDARVSLSRNSGLGNTGNPDNVFAWQLMAGISYAPVSMPLTEWSIGYRFFDAMDPEFSTATGKVKLDDMMSHGAEVGARFRF